VVPGEAPPGVVVHLQEDRRRGGRVLAEPRRAGVELDLHRREERRVPSRVHTQPHRARRRRRAEVPQEEAEEERRMEFRLQVRALVRGRRDVERSPKAVPLLGPERAGLLPERSPCRGAGPAPPRQRAARVGGEQPREGAELEEAVRETPRSPRTPPRGRAPGLLCGARRGAPGRRARCRRSGSGGAACGAARGIPGRSTPAAPARRCPGARPWCRPTRTRRPPSRCRALAGARAAAGRRSPAARGAQGARKGTAPRRSRRAAAPNARARARDGR